MAESSLPLAPLPIHPCQDKSRYRIVSFVLLICAALAYEVCWGGVSESESAREIEREREGEREGGRRQ